jgi:hypothetical protein
MKGEKFILAIAIDKYSEAYFQPLSNAIHDTKRVIKVLTEKYGFQVFRKPLFNKLATRRGIIEFLNESMTSLTEDDCLVIYHAGHGVIHPQSNRGYWIPSDASTTVGDWIIHAEIKEYIAGCVAKHILLIDDSCFSGAFLEKSRSAEGTFTNHYKKLDIEKSRWILTSGRSEKVSDGEKKSGSPFANALINFLEINQSKHFSTSEMSVYVAKQTGNITIQQPRWGSIDNVGHKGGEMVFELQSNTKRKNRRSRTWEENLELFISAKAFRQEWPFISKMNPETRELGRWCQEQRTTKKKNSLSKEREGKLKAAGFIFDPQIEKFYNGLAKFLKFMHKTGLNDVPGKLIPQYASENAWHRQQQKWYAKSPCVPNNPKSYPEYRYKVLVKAGIPIEPNEKEESWNMFKNDIIKYYESHTPLISIPSQTDRDQEIASLGQRTNDWMVRWKRYQLSEERVKFLAKFVDKDYYSNKVKRGFLAQIQAYLNFRDEFPDENPSSKARTRLEVKRVIDWKAQVNHRLRDRTSPIQKWKIEELDKIGFLWTKKESKPVVKPQLKLNL